MFNFPSNPVRWVIPENFGIDPPIGSEKSKSKIPNQMLKWEFLELDKVPCSGLYTRLKAREKEELTGMMAVVMPVLDKSD